MCDLHKVPGGTVFNLMMDGESRLWLDGVSVIPLEGVPIPATVSLCLTHERTRMSRKFLLQHRLPVDSPLTLMISLNLEGNSGDAIERRVEPETVDNDIHVVLGKDCLQDMTIRFSIWKDNPEWKSVGYLFYPASTLPVVQLQEDADDHGTFSR